MKNIYLSSPFFNEEEVKNVRKAESILKNRGFKVFVPLDFCIDRKNKTERQWAKEIFTVDKVAIDKCDAMVLLYYGLYSDSGTAWECGYAYAKNKPVIVVHCQSKEKNNLMIVNGCYTNLQSIDSLKTYNFSTLGKTEFCGHTSQS